MLHTPHQSPQAAATIPVQRTPERDDQAGPWHAEAVCRRDEAGLFFAPSKEPTAARLSREQAAKRVCARCPVLVECREHALVMPEPYGVWGGLTAAERRVVLTRRRKTASASASAGQPSSGVPRIA
ncbi:WhiB family transcriptional regulator [Streptomyces oryzae]|uniref:Transcriptional regulator WhiB n=1 Tax=Streptomyces oryzae TaxID=1434886 RepID=A0ABS3XFG1_9ACTN|nr:WhiB family transcriptional regulator [Streptomyces oryzae]MBO8193836.1 WhiB family transcriptional regulator [Streptomyces oryzae]